MLKRHNKKGASVWDRKLTVVLGFLFGITVLLFAVLVLTLFISSADVDECLDRGGSYDHEEGRCDLDADPTQP